MPVLTRVFGLDVSQLIIGLDIMDADFCAVLPWCRVPALRARTAPQQGTCCFSAHTRSGRYHTKA